MHICPAHLQNLQTENHQNYDYEYDGKDLPGIFHMVNATELIWGPGHSAGAERREATASFTSSNQEHWRLSITTR